MGANLCYRHTGVYHILYMVLDILSWANGCKWTGELLNNHSFVMRYDMVLIYCFSTVVLFNCRISLSSSLRHIFVGAIDIIWFVCTISVKFNPMNHSLNSDVALQHVNYLLMVMAWRWTGDKPFWQQKWFRHMLAYCQLDPWEQISVKYNLYVWKWTRKWSLLCKMAAIRFWPHWVKQMQYKHWLYDMEIRVFAQAFRYTINVSI